jgi:transcriptional regulator with XRE-family HTH domain
MGLQNSNLDFYPALAIAIKLIRKEKRLSQNRVRLSANILSHRLIPQVESGSMKIKLHTMLKICRGLEMRPSAFMTIVDRMLEDSTYFNACDLSVKDLRPSHTIKKNVSNYDQLTGTTGKHFQYVIGSIIQELRLSKNISLGRLMRASKISGKTTVAKFESGLQCPRLTTLFKLAEGLNLKASYVVELVEEKFVVEARSYFNLRANQIFKRDETSKKK